MAEKAKQKFDKKGYSNSFNLVGEAKISEDYTYKIDEKSEKSDWVYNSLNLGVYCGEAYGTVYAELMGGYGAERDNVVFVHGKKEDGSDDPANKFQIDWDDRFDDNILETVGDMCFLTVGLEKDTKGYTVYKKFLTPYDAIAYVNEHLENGMVLNVKGTLKYSKYNDQTTVKKEISSIVLSNSEKEKYRATFRQTILLTKDCMGKVDKDKGILPIYAKVIDYLKEYKGKTVKANVPYDKNFEYELDMTNPERTKKVIEVLFKVKKDVTEITFEGDLIEGGAVITATLDDLPDDIRELVDIGVYTEEEALTRCTVNSGKQKRMVLRKPATKQIKNDDESTTTKVLRTERKFTEDDLVMDYMTDSDDEDEESEEETTDTKFSNKAAKSDDDSSWLDNL